MDNIGVYITIAIALFVACVGYQQYRINKENFRLALFEKRYAVFVAASQLLAKIGQDASVEVSDMAMYLNRTASAKFLFDDSVVEFLDKIYGQSNKLRTANAKLKGNRVPDERRSKIVDEEEEALEALIQSLSEIRKKFMPYLGFAKKP